MNADDRTEMGRLRVENLVLRAENARLREGGQRALRKVTQALSLVLRSWGPDSNDHVKALLAGLGGPPPETSDPET